MPGKLCRGSADRKFVKDSRAFCEGMQARVASTTTTNPHVAGTDAADAWDAGVAVADANEGGQISKADQGCCAAGGTVAGP